jgi:hypothetical protein
MTRISPFNAKRINSPNTFATMLVSDGSSGAGSSRRVFRYFTSRGVSTTEFLDTFVGSWQNPKVKNNTNYWLSMFQ